MSVILTTCPVCHGRGLATRAAGESVDCVNCGAALEQQGDGSYRVTQRPRGELYWPEADDPEPDDLGLEKRGET